MESSEVEAAVNPIMPRYAQLVIGPAGSGKVGILFCLDEVLVCARMCRDIRLEANRGNCVRRSGG